MGKPSVVHADTVTPATTQSADAKSTVNQDNQLKNYYNMAQKADQENPSDWTAELVNKTQEDYDKADKTLSDAADAVKPYQKASTDDSGKKDQGNKGNTGDKGNNGDSGYVPSDNTNTNANTNTTAETPASGVAYMPIINNGPNCKVNMMDADGHYTNVYLTTNSKWRVFGKKTINGVECYRLGNQNQWVPARYLDFNLDDAENQSNGETPLSGTARVTYTGRGPVRLLNSEGNYVDQYIPKRSAWKVFAEKTVNGQHLYRLGNQDQWVPAQYVALS